MRIPSISSCLFKEDAARSSLHRVSGCAGSCIHPRGNLLLKYAVNRLQIYDKDTKKIQQETALPVGPAVLIKWISKYAIGIVTATEVYHWTIGQQRPLRQFPRHSSLKDSQIIDYEVSANGKWCVLKGIRLDAGDGVTGQMQLYSVERKVSQLVPAHAGTFSTIEAGQTEVFAFVDIVGATGTVRLPSCMMDCTSTFTV